MTTNSAKFGQCRLATDYEYLPHGRSCDLGRVLINRYVRQLAVDVRIAPESGRIRNNRSTSQKCH
jgi:hypothetical protein